MLTTYELISRELDAIYIYLPNDVSANKEGLHYERGADEYLRNQIYVLMTRAKGSVWIYCENPSAYQYRSERCEKLIKRAEVRTPYDKEEEERCNALATLIEERGITRLVHFTAEENLPSIYDHGLMSVAKLDKSGIKYDKNDTDRADNIPDGISLSVQNPNQYLLRHFCQKYPNKKYVILSLDPALLYEIPDDESVWRLGFIATIMRRQRACIIRGQTWRSCFLMYLTGDRGSIRARGKERILRRQIRLRSYSAKR